MLFSKTFYKYFALYIFIGLTSTVFWTCKDDTFSPSVADTYLGYFPLAQQFWVEYTVDSVVHLSSDDLLHVDTAIESYHYEIREVIDSGFIDGQGDSAFSIARYKRTNDTLPWSIMNIWTAKRNDQSAQRVEDNIRYIKLSFPVSYRSIWNGNAYNTFDEEDYQYDNIHSSLTFNGQEFDSTVTVIQNIFESDINRINKQEIYAMHVGMVYKQLDSLNTQRQPTGAVIILNGTEYLQTVTNYKH